MQALETVIILVFPPPPLVSGLDTKASKTQDRQAQPITPH